MAYWRGIRAKDPWSVGDRMVDMRGVRLVCSAPFEPRLESAEHP